MIKFIEGKDEHTETEAREKNIEEYNKTADHYEQWSKENILM